MSYLFMAFSSVWVGIFLYNFYLVRGMERLEGELRTLEDFIAEQERRQS